MTYAGTPKLLHFALDRERFDKIAREAGARLVYRQVDGFLPNLPEGSFENEHKQRRAIARLLDEEAARGNIPPGSLVLQSDVDEIESRETLELLTLCSGYPDDLHLNVDNYRYSFDQPLRDAGYRRPRVYTVGEDGKIPYHHSRSGDNILAEAGWHCTFCIPTLQDMRTKMLGYAHYDRTRHQGLLEEAALRRRVCEGRNPFAMYPETFSFKELVAQSGEIRKVGDLQKVLVALKEEPGRFGYLLADGYERPDH